MEESTKHDEEHDIEVRANGSQIYSEPYTEAGINRLKNIILTLFSQGEKKYYSILVDGETVVSKNCDGRKFDNYLRFVNSHTRIIEVRMFQGYSPNCNRHQFYPQKALSGFSSTDAQSQIEKALEAQEYKHQLAIKDLRHEMDLMQRELEAKKKKLRRLQNAPAPEPEKKTSTMEDIKEMAQLGIQIVGAIKGNPQQQQEQMGGTEQQPVEVTVEAAKESATQEEQPQSTAQKTFNKLMAAYGEERVFTALKWLAFLAANPSVQEKIKEEANNQKSNEHGQA